MLSPVQPEDVSFAEFVKDRTRGSSASTGAAVVAGELSPSSNLVVENQPIVPVALAEDPLYAEAFIPAPIVEKPVFASPAPVAASPEAKKPEDFTDYLNQFVAETKKTIAENVTSPRHAASQG